MFWRNTATVYFYPILVIFNLNFPELSGLRGRIKWSHFDHCAALLFTTKGK